MDYEMQRLPAAMFRRSTKEEISFDEFSRLQSEMLDMMPRLMAKRRDLRLVGLNPTSVLVPDRFHIEYTGEDADPMFKGSLMGLPLEFSRDDKWGLVVNVEGK